MVNFKVYVAGVLSPLAMLANALLHHLDETSGHRAVLCGLLIQARSTIKVVYPTILLFSIMFRTVLILHSDKGLVTKGAHNLELFNQLFWIIVGCFLVMLQGVTLFRNNFLEGTTKGQICLLLNLDGDDDGRHKFIMIRTTFAIGNIILAHYLQLRVKSFLSGHCPQKKMSCIGIYPRNLISFRSTLVWNDAWCALVLLDVLLEIFFRSSSNHFSSTVMFWIWNVKGFISVEGFHLIFPHCFDLPYYKTDNLSPVKFYVRSEKVLVPRRAPVDSSSRNLVDSFSMVRPVIHVSECKKQKFSSIFPKNSFRK